MDPEEPGLLGNLPRSRPGTRSEKRSGKTGSKPAPKRSQAAKPGVKSTAAAKARKPAPRKPAAKPPDPEPSAPNPVEAAVKVAGAGLRVAEGVTREVLRRLPRP